MPLGTFGGPIFFRPTDAANFFRVESIRRTFGGTKVPLYRGAIEIARGSSTQANRVNVVNVVELEDYVPGVVVNESLSSFQVAALEAQAVAARGYAVANIGRYGALGYPFDIVDSSSSQVYRGVISEHLKAVQAATETTGLVASYDGRIITAFYSSSFGGYSESNEWIFNSPSSQLPGSNAIPYLRGIYDGDGTPPDFSTEEGIAAFSDGASTLDLRRLCPGGQSFLALADRTDRRPDQGAPDPSCPSSSGATSAGPSPTFSSPAGWAPPPAAIARISLTTGEVEVRGWDNLRNARPHGGEHAGDVRRFEHRR